MTTNGLILFDIDGTLVVTGGAGQRALDRAFQALFGIPAAFADIELPGRTDPVIIADAFARHGVAGGDDLYHRFRAEYTRCLAAELLVDGPRKRELPGVRALLEALTGTTASPGVGLLTGNFEPTARLKLEHFDLWRYFRYGAYGDDAADRNGLVPVAVSRAGAQGHGPVVVIGDTPRDVACAHAGGARCLAVATGSSSVDDLRRAGADAVFADLADTAVVLGAITALRAS